MATLVLSAAGMIVGGPIGAAVGSFIGQAIDRRIFAPPTVKGPRLGDLSVQTSTYGSDIPRVYGTMRVAGTVIWASDLKEHSHSSGGGKSGASTKTYTYSASFAVALSSRTGMVVDRIWADGKLLRGHKGDLKRRTRYRFYAGGEKQPVDPLIASLEGAGKASAHRGLCYVVFEDLDLSDFGNRIPQLTFELKADEGSVPLSTILDDMTDGLIVGPKVPPMLEGFAAHGDSRLSAVRNLATLFDLPLVERGGRLHIDDHAEEIFLPAPGLRSCTSGEMAKEAGETQKLVSSGEMPASLSLAYYDPARDYQVGVAQSVIAGGGRGAWREEAAAVLDASEAKVIANRAMAAQWAGRERRQFCLSPCYVELTPAQTIRFSGDDGRWRVEKVAVEGLVVRADVRREAGSFAATDADPGRPAPVIDRLIGRNRVKIADLPALDGRPTNKASVWLAVASDAFSPAPVIGWINGAETVEVLAERAALIGTCDGVLLSTVSPWLSDEVSTIVVQLVDRDGWLMSADAKGLDSGQNLALVGSEIVQFGVAEAMGDGKFRLSSFRRGRLGTEWAVGLHIETEEFLLIERANMMSLDIDSAAVGATLLVQSFGLGDDPLDPPQTMIALSGEATRPLAPVAIGLATLPNGDGLLTWQMRDRRALAWEEGLPIDTGPVRVIVDLDDGIASFDVANGVNACAIPSATMALLPNPCPASLTAITAEGRSRPWRQLLKI